jgi:hypothetical protein
VVSVVLVALELVSRHVLGVHRLLGGASKASAFARACRSAKHAGRPAASTRTWHPSVSSSAPAAAAPPFPALRACLAELRIPAVRDAAPGPSLARVRLNLRGVLRLLMSQRVADGAGRVA